jgi:hypothetical protein
MGSSSDQRAEHDLDYLDIPDFLRKISDGHESGDEADRPDYSAMEGQRQPTPASNEGIEYDWDYLDIPAFLRRSDRVPEELLKSPREPLVKRGLRFLRELLNPRPAVPNPLDERTGSPSSAVEPGLSNLERTSPDTGPAVSATSDSVAQDPLFDEAVDFVIHNRSTSISSLQRQLEIDFNRAARMIEEMERLHIVGTADQNGYREVFGPPPPEK